ncbi:MAG: DNA primase [Patescibacteria group bacterium]|nr:DNA primase [Patescibacteria group bacterium]
MDSQVQEIKNKLSINDVVGQYVQLQRAGRNFRAKCPFHKERTPSFMVSPERGTYMCFGCGEKGDIFSFVQKMDGVDFPTALKQLAEKAGVKLKKNFAPAPEHKEHDERLKDVLEAATVFFESKLAGRKDVADYIRARGVHDDTTKTWRLGYAPASWRELTEHLASLEFKKDEIVDAGLAIDPARSNLADRGSTPGNIYDRFRGRIMFPLFDMNGKVIAFSGRFFEDMPGDARKTDAEPRAEPAKYVNSPETALFKKSRMLYGLHIAKNFIRKADCILLVEGQFDVVMSHQSGLPFTVAISGTALTDEHLSLLGRLSKRLVLALDADSAGIRAGLKSTLMAYSHGFDVKVPALPEGKDPADVAKENPELLKAAVRTSKTAIEFFLDVLRPQAKDERAYKKLAESRVLPLIAALQSAIEQEHFVRITASRLEVSEAAVRAEVAKKPALHIEETEPAPLQTAERTNLEKAAGMLIFYFPHDAELQKKLSGLLGEERYASIQKQLEPEAEALRFLFESLGEETAAAKQSLFDTIERSQLEEEMNLVQHQLHETGSDQKSLLHKLSFLKRRQQELRK